MARGAGVANPPKPGRGGGGGKGGMVGYTGMTPGQFAKYVNAQVNGEFNPEFSALKAYQGGLDRVFRGEIGETNKGSKELAGMFAQIAPAVRGEYQDAANADTGFAKGFGDQLGSVAPGVNPGVGSVLGTEFGLIPGQSLEQQGAGMTAAADLLPQTAEGLRNSAVGAIEGDQYKSDLSMQSKVATLLGEEGRARVQIANSVQSQADRAYGLRLSTQRTAFSEQATQKRLQLEAQRQSFSEKMQLQRLGLEKQRERMTAFKDAYSLAHGGFSQERISELTLKATGMARQDFAGTTTYHTITTTDPSTGQKVTREVPLSKGGISYNEALGGMLKEGIPVQIALVSLNQQYPANMRPSDEMLQHILGGLTPSNIDKAIVRAGLDRKIQGAFGGSFNGLQGPGAFTVGGAFRVQQNLNRLAHEYLGTRYTWGGTSPKTGFDCSGFAQFLYGKIGINIPRTSEEQWTAGRPIDPHNLQVGDLVFFKGSDSVGGLPGHVGIYIGNGMMIDAPHTGSSVRIESVGKFGGFMGARRFDGVPTSGVKGAQYTMPQAPQHYQQIATQMMGKYGWHDEANIQALDRLWNKESGWNPNAHNARSGAAGIPQALGHTLPPGYQHNPLVQIRWGLHYIHTRYGSPLKAWEHEMAFGWY